MYFTNTSIPTPIKSGIKMAFPIQFCHITPPKKPKKIPSHYCAHSTIGTEQIEDSLILLIFDQTQTPTQALFQLCEYLKSRH